MEHAAIVKIETNVVENNMAAFFTFAYEMTLSVKNIRVAEKPV